MRSKGGRTPVLVLHNLTTLVSLLALVYGVIAVELYSYESHVQLPAGNEEMGTVDLTTPFIMFQQEYTEITVNTNWCTVFS